MQFSATFSLGKVNVTQVSPQDGDMSPSNRNMTLVINLNLSCPVRLLTCELCYDYEPYGGYVDRMTDGMATT